MRVLFSAHGAYGHVLPLVPLARALDGAGHEVRFAVAEELCAAVAGLGLAPASAGMSDAALLAEARRRWPDVDREPPARWARSMFTDIAGPAMAADLVGLIAAWQPDLLVREEGEYGAELAAASARVPCAVHGWGSPLEARPDIAAAVAVLDPCPPSLYGQCPPEIPRTVVRPLGTALPRTAAAPTLPRPLAYVGFGTVPIYRDRPELLRLVTAALLKRGWSVVVTTPDEELQRHLQAAEPDRVLATPWVSLPDLLPGCDLVVAHGGAGTVLAALAHGAPLLLIPSGSPSQLRLSEACADRGAARVLAAAASSALDAAVADITGDSRYREAAGELAAEIAAMPDPAAAIPVLERATFRAARPAR